MKNIIREVSPGWMDTSMYFDDDGIRDYDGKHFNYNLFIVYSEHYGRYSGLNIETYKDVIYEAEKLIEDISQMRLIPDGNFFDIVLTFSDAEIERDTGLLKVFNIVLNILKVIIIF